MRGSKSIFKSLTLWSLLFMLLGFGLQAYAEGGPAAVVSDPDVRSTLGDVFGIVGAAGVAIGRIRAGRPLHVLSRNATTATAGAMVVGLMAAGMSQPGCAGVERCPDDQGVVASYQAGPPSYMSARCSGDDASVHRRQLEAPSRGTFEVICPEGTAPGPEPDSTKPGLCDGLPCSRSELTCVPVSWLQSRRAGPCAPPSWLRPSSPFQDAWARTAQPTPRMV